MRTVNGKSGGHDDKERSKGAEVACPLKRGFSGDDGRSEGL